MTAPMNDAPDAGRPLAGRLAVVTGSTSGIGLGIARGARPPGKKR